MCGLAAPSSCSAKPGSRSSSWGCSIARRGSGGAGGSPPTQGCTHCVCAFRWPPDSPAAFTAHPEPCSGCRGCPSPVTALSLPAQVERGLPAGFVPGILPASLRSPAWRGERTRGTLARGREPGLQPGGFWHAGTPPWAMNVGTRGCRAQCHPARMGDAKPVLPQSWAISEASGNCPLQSGRGGVRSFPQMRPPNPPVVLAWHDRVPQHFGWVLTGVVAPSLAPGLGLQGLRVCPGRGRSGCCYLRMEMRWHLRSWQISGCPPAPCAPSLHMPLRGGCRQALRGGWERWLERV